MTISDSYIELAKHCIGLDYKKPYIRHEKQFYKPYRNYYCTYPNDEVWLNLEKQEYAKHSSEHNGCVDFYIRQAKKVLKTLQIYTYLVIYIFVLNDNRKSYFLSF